ncbi:helix-turn-helix domain-containing protein [Nannocystis exedens]|uniref:helix-turn-helix domain-containing protein n=1 Tax=Nannocystis exedens TaxID=54 RepID=UPI000BBA09EE
MSRLARERSCALPEHAHRNLCRLRIRIVEARAQEGLTYEQLAERFSVGRATVDRTLRLARETGSVEPKPHGGGVARRITAQEQELLVELVRARPDATLAELCIALQIRAGVQISRATMCRELQRLGFTRKKIAGGSGAMHGRGRGDAQRFRRADAVLRSRAPDLPRRVGLAHLDDPHSCVGAAEGSASTASYPATAAARRRCSGRSPSTASRR